MLRPISADLSDSGPGRFARGSLSGLISFRKLNEDLRRDKALAFWKKVPESHHRFCHHRGGGDRRLFRLAVRKQQTIEAMVPPISRPSRPRRRIPRPPLPSSRPWPRAAAVCASWRGSRQANQTLKDGDKAKAAEQFTAIANDGSVDKALKDLAAVLGGLAWLDAGKPDEAAKLVEPLTGDNQPYRFSALEVKAQAAFACGDKAKAKEVYGQLKQLGSCRTRRKACWPGPRSCSNGCRTEHRDCRCPSCEAMRRSPGGGSPGAGAGSLRIRQEAAARRAGSRCCSSNKELNIDPALSETPVRLPRPYENKDWPQAGGNQAHAMYHLQAGTGAFKQLWSANIGERRRQLQPPAGRAGDRRRQDLHPGSRKPGPRVRRRDRQEDLGERPRRPVTTTVCSAAASRSMRARSSSPRPSPS